MGDISHSSLTPMAKTIDVVLLEDHPLYLEGLAAFVKKQLPNVNIAYDGGSFIEAKRIATEKKVALALVDLSLEL